MVFPAALRDRSCPRATGAHENGGSIVTDWQTFDFRIAEHYLPALINADESGMTDEESADLETWVSAVQREACPPGYSVGHWCDVDGSGEDWGRCDVSGLFAMRCTVRLHCYRATEHA